MRGITSRAFSKYTHTQKKKQTHKGEKKKGSMIILYSMRSASSAPFAFDTAGYFHSAAFLCIDFLQIDCDDRRIAASPKTTTEKVEQQQQKITATNRPLGDHLSSEIRMQTYRIGSEEFNTSAHPRIESGETSTARYGFYCAATCHPLWRGSQRT